MAQSKDAPQSSLPLEELFRGYLARQIEAQSHGLGFAEPDDEVLPYDAAPVQPIDPQLAWDEARSVLKCFAGLTVPCGLPVPPDWPVLVANHEPAVSLAFCLGNFPQLVRTVQPLLSGGLASYRPRANGAAASPALVEWARGRKEPCEVLLAVGVLRLARDYDEAIQLLNTLRNTNEEWAPVAANERGAVAWHAGHFEDALKLWQSQKESLPVLFNRGTALLFLGRPAEARAPLLKAASGLADSNSWHHLAHLYLAMAQART